MDTRRCRFLWAGIFLTVSGLFLEVVMLVEIFSEVATMPRIFLVAVEVDGTEMCLEIEKHLASSLTPHIKVNFLSGILQPVEMIENVSKFQIGGHRG